MLNGELFYTLHEARVIVVGGANATTRTARIVRWGIDHPPQRPNLRTAQRVGVKELDRWLNNWGWSMVVHIYYTWFNFVRRLYPYI